MSLPIRKIWQKLRKTFFDKLGRSTREAGVLEECWNVSRCCPIRKLFKFKIKKNYISTFAISTLTIFLSLLRYLSDSYRSVKYITH